MPFWPLSVREFLVSPPSSSHPFGGSKRGDYFYFLLFWRGNSRVSAEFRGIPRNSAVAGFQRVAFVLRFLRVRVVRKPGAAGFVRPVVGCFLPLLLRGHQGWPSAFLRH